MQLLRNLLDHRLNPQQAVDAPRWYLEGTGKTQSSQDMLESELLLEDGYGAEQDFGPFVMDVLSALRKKGHHVGPLVKDRERVMYGKAQVIVKDPQTGVLWAGSGIQHRAMLYFLCCALLLNVLIIDPRSDGCALPMI